MTCVNPLISSQHRALTNIGLTFAMCHNGGKNDFPIEYIFISSWRRAPCASHLFWQLGLFMNTFL